MSIPRSRATWVLIGCLTAVVIACVVYSFVTTTDPPQLLLQARTALEVGAYRRAEQIASRIPEDAVEKVAGYLLSGEAAQRDGRPRESARYYTAVLDLPANDDDTAMALFSAAEAHRELGELSVSVDLYRRTLSLAPNNGAAHERLAYLHSLSGRRWDALPHYFFLARSGSATIDELILFGDLDRPIERLDYLKECASKAPDDPTVALGIAAHAFWEGDSETAEASLLRLLQDESENLTGQAMLGELLVERDVDALIEWHQRLPASADLHPDIWYVRGRWAQRNDQQRMACRCFWQAARLHPTHRRAIYQLGQLLTSLDEERGQDYVAQARLLVELTQVLDDILRSKSSREAPIRRAVELLEQTGRVWEACAWGVVARKKFPDADWPRELLARNRSLLNDSLPLVIQEQNLALRHDMSDYPEFVVDKFRPNVGVPAGDSGNNSAEIVFVEESGLLDFVYENGDDVGTKGSRQFEQTGGGVAALDYDSDGHVDLFFTQGAQWKTGDLRPTISRQTTDTMFRSQDGIDFADSTTRSLPDDLGFGQGCAAGDFNNDGFTDLYVANTGRNQLLQNLGDGTFLDVSDSAGLSHEDWTASVIIVDMNADDVPDLFDVNYLEGEGVFEAICNGRACSPSVFAAAPDRLLMGRGDGAFDSQKLAIPKDSSKGLGVVTFFSEDSRRPSLFIANDQTANFLLKNRAAENRFNIELYDDAFSTGVAFDGDGLAMACMGIAADDANGDGYTDLFVTNFADESNTLYAHVPGGLFQDVSSTAGLKATSYSYVGWGTQFLDADLDGWSDLVVTNGHVDDFRDEGGQYKMRPQFFRNTGGGRFKEPPAKEIGRYFLKKFRGRGLARLDWNQDGLMDFVVSNIGDQASLVTNKSVGTGRFLGIRCHATTTARDAIGSTVIVSTQTRRWTKYLLAGDGYMASNEKLIHFGIGNEDAVSRVEIRWPSGATTTIADAPSDVTIDVVEGSVHATLWRAARPETLTVSVKTQSTGNTH